MAMKARYTVVKGEVVAEKRGGKRNQYVPDPLGSTTALLDGAQTQTDTFQYWPYGEVASRTGMTATPFQYVGTLGYYRDTMTRNYVRARYLDTAAGRWMTEDPIGLKGGDYNIYRYCRNSPSGITDASGLSCRGLHSTGTIDLADIVYCRNQCASEGKKPGTPKCTPLPFCFGQIMQLQCNCGPSNKCKGRVCPTRPPRKDCPPSSPHYIPHLGGCCYGCHIHVYVATQGPAPDCHCSYKEVDDLAVCLGGLVPGDCLRGPKK